MPDGLEMGSMIAGQFRIRERIAEGGMGAMYLAEQLGLDRLVAIKVIRSASDRLRPELLARLQREARALGQLQHQNIVTVFSVGALDSGDPFIAMEYVKGSTLADLLKGGALSWKRAVDIAAQVANGLQQAHRARLVHRDLKPANIMVSRTDEGRDLVKILDFGIVKSLDVGEHLTVPGALFGTPQYLAPEQARGARVDARTDIYALGLVLYEMLTGERAFAAQTLQELVGQHLYAEPTPPRVRRPELPKWVDAIVLRCLEKDPAKRYMDAEQLRLALMTPAQSPAPQAWEDLREDRPNTPVAEPARKERRKLPASSWMIFAGVMVLALGAAASGTFSHRSQAREPLLSFMSSNAGWVVSVSLPVPATRLRYRLGSQGVWTDTGESQQLDERTGRVAPVSWFMLPPGQPANTIFVSFTDAHGDESEPYAYAFEPRAELARSMRRNLDQIWTSWIAFRDWQPGYLVYFTALVTYRCGLQEVRYGLDGAPPTTRFDLPACDPANPIAMGANTKVWIEVPKTTRSITIDLTYADGTQATPRTFDAPHAP